MAYFKSAIVYKTGEVISLPYSDSHEDIIRWVGNIQDGGGKRTWCRVEYVPSDGYTVWDLDNYTLRLDESSDYISSWFTPMRDKVEEKMQDLVRKQVLIGATDKSTLLHGIYFIGKGCFIKTVLHCQIPETYEADIGHCYNSQLGHIRNTKFYDIDRCSVDEISGAQTKSIISGHMTRSVVINYASGYCRTVEDSIIAVLGEKVKIQYFGGGYNTAMIGTLRGELQKTGIVYAHTVEPTAILPPGTTLYTNADLRASAQKARAKEAELVNALQQKVEVLTKQLEKGGLKMPRFRIKKPKELLGKDKFPLYDRDGSFAICTVCQRTYGEHLGWDCP
jgi:hypothetical protein